MSGDDAVYVDPDWDLSALPFCTLCGCHYTRGTAHACRDATRGQSEDRKRWNEGDLVRFNFANGTAIEGYVRFSGSEPWLDCGVGPFANVLGPWFDRTGSPLRGLTPTLLRAAPPLIKSADPVIQAVAQALLGEDAHTASDYTYRVDAEHAWDLAEIAVSAMRAVRGGDEDE